VPVGKARLKTFGISVARAGYSCGLAVLLLLVGSRGLQTAVAEGDTRTITMHHIHTGEDITITYKRDGIYDEAALEKLNWFLRDWRRSEATRMDPHLIDLVWEVQRETGSKEPIQVVCGYRTPQTNAMLRRRSSGVARFSQHMLGKAMDFYIPGVPLEQLREIGLRLQRGGVGFYPTSGSPFVHMDTGGIRMWPRMTHEELVRVFPDGRTVHIPTDGRPLSGYALALADIRKRGSDPSENSIEAARKAGVDVGSVAVNDTGAHTNLFAKLLGLRSSDPDEDEDAAEQTSTASITPNAGPHAKPLVLAKLEHAAAKTVAEAPKLIHAVATMSRAEASQTAATSRPDDSAGRFAAVTPNQVISTRGYWEGLSDAESTAQPAAMTSQGASRAGQGVLVASANPGITGVISSWRDAAQDRVPLELALAYAEQPTADATRPAMTTSVSADPAGRLIAQNGVTIAMKGIVDRPKTTFQKATQLVATAVKVGKYFDDPWLRAIVVSPSVRRFLTTETLGPSDFITLAVYMVKPSSSVMMTFSSDPNLGMTPDHFSGSAVVFVPTVTYPTQTASLQ
jgi:uncharacterized protein YcbK (DUF882 family)